MVVLAGGGHRWVVVVVGGGGVHALVVGCSRGRLRVEPL